MCTFIIAIIIDSTRHCEFKLVSRLADRMLNRSCFYEIHKLTVPIRTPDSLHSLCVVIEGPIYISSAQW